MTSAVLARSHLPPARVRTRKPAIRADNDTGFGGAITLRPLDSLVAYAGNPRKHPEKQIAMLARAIAEFGFLVPVLITGDGEIVAGAARVAAARRAGLDEVSTILVEHLSKAQIKRFRLFDNRVCEHGEWDQALVAVEMDEILALGCTDITDLGWETGEIDAFRVLGAEDMPEHDAADVVPEAPAVPVTRTGDLWLLGRHRLMCGTSLEAAPWTVLMDGREARLCFSDPPYNVPISGHVCGGGKIQHAEFKMASGEMSEAEFIAFLTTSLTVMAAPLVDGAVLQICMDWRHLFALETAARSVGLTTLNLCVWNKSNAGMGSLYRSKHELVLILKKGKARHVNTVELGKHGRNRTNVWDYPGVNGFGKTRMKDLAAHPTVKPLALVADAICDVTRHGEIVIDGFMGSGTTLLAAERTKRLAYGLEIEPGYVDVAVRRWQEMTGQQAVLAATGEMFDRVAVSRIPPSDTPLTA